MACLAVAGAIVLKVIDYGWTAYDAYQYSQIILDPNSSPEAIAQAKDDLFTAIVLEGLEPDELLPLGIPLDDIVRHWDDISPILAAAFTTYKKVDGYVNFDPAKDLDWRGTEHTFSEALDEAFRRTGVPRDQFVPDEWAEDAYGKTHVSVWKVIEGPNTGAEVNVDLEHLTNPNAPQVPHVGYQTPGKRHRGEGVRGHILLDDVPYNRE